MLWQNYFLVFAGIASAEYVGLSKQEVRLPVSNHEGANLFPDASFKQAGQL